MKTLLDFSPALAFFAVYYLGGGLFPATAALIACSVALVLIYRLWQRKWHLQHLFTAALVSVFGGLTLAIGDPDFIKIKPSVLYAGFALALLGSHVVGDKVLLQRLGQRSFALPDTLWRRINLAWVLFFAGCAVLNYYVASHFDEQTWVNFKTFGFTGLTLVFMLGHLPFVARHLQDASGEKPAS